MLAVRLAKLVNSQPTTMPENTEIIRVMILHSLYNKVYSSSFSIGLLSHS